MHSVQEPVVAVLRERAGRAWAAADPTPGALVAAAFGCLIAAQHAWLAADTTEPLAGFIDRAMAALTPAG